MNHEIPSAAFGRNQIKKDYSRPWLGPFRFNRARVSHHADPKAKSVLVFYPWYCPAIRGASFGLFEKRIEGLNLPVGVPVKKQSGKKIEWQKDRRPFVIVGRRFFCRRVQSVAPSPLKSKLHERLPRRSLPGFFWTHNRKKSASRCHLPRHLGIIRIPMAPVGR
jgi:hypothetical protein